MVTTRGSSSRHGARVIAHVAIAALSAGFAASVGSAQTPDSVPPPCDGRIIRGIDVEPHPPGVIGRSPSAWRRAAQRLLLQSTTTRAGVVRSFVLTDVGRRCSAALIEEVARVLRSQPYIASASVRAVHDSTDGVRLLVETFDEIPLIIGGGYSDGGVSNVTFGNANLAGRGLQVVGRWRDGGAYRHGLSMALRQHGLAGRPIVLALDLVRNPLGDQTSYSATRPFLSDLQRFAWHVGGLQSTSFHHFARPSGSTESLPVDRDVWAGGAVMRFAWRERGVLVGPVMTYERVRPASAGVIVSDSGLVPAVTTELTGRYSPYEVFRLGATLGLRLLSYREVAGFDALAGQQDIARGLQVGAVVARGLGAFGADDRSSFVSMDLYSGAGNARSFAGLRLRGEGARQEGAARWSAVVLSGRGAWYLKPSESRTVEASAEFSGGWRETLPLHLSLGDARAGVRGYKGAPIAGGRRAIFRLEQRKAMGSLGPAARWGLAAFTDVGKTWSGDVPFGETTIARASVGAGLLVAVPPRSRRTIRVDVAVPVTGDAPKRWLLRVAAFDATRSFWREPGDVARVRAGAPTSSIFGWP